MLYSSRAGVDSRVGLPPRTQRPCLIRGGRRRGERVRQGGQGTQSRARALDGQGALLTTRWAAYRRGFDSRWQLRLVHARKHACGCPARNLLRRSALSLESFPSPPSDEQRLQFQIETEAAEAEVRAERTAILRLQSETERAELDARKAAAEEALATSRHRIR